jgi:tetratricopeptide (TPR) repeat protein
MNFQIERLKQLPQHPHERWQGGLFRMPTWVPNDDDKLYRPWSAAWVNPIKHKLSSPTIETAEHKNFAIALDSLVQFACDTKLAGYRPGMLEVKDPALAEYLQGTLADAGIAVEYRSQLVVFDAMIVDFTRFIHGDKLLPDALSAKRVTIDMMRSFADAAAEFYKAAPWRYLCDVDLVAIEAPFVDPLLRYTTLLGNSGVTYGITFYDSADMFEKFVTGKGIEAISGKDYWTLFFGGMDELPFGDADLWEDHDLPVASPQAYPLAMMFDPRGRHRRPQPDILAFLEGLMRVFAQTSESEMDSGKWQKTVRTFAGDKTFTLSLPGMQESAEDVRKKVIKHGGIPDRRAMEKIHTDIQRILEGHDFDSPDEMQKFLNKNFVGKKVPEQYPMTPLEQAQDICYEAFEARGRKQIMLAKKALEICPDCVDAYVLLAEACSSLTEAHDLYANGVKAGERLLGEQFFKENIGHFWGITQTRPYMRALAGMADTLAGMGRIDDAIGHYQELLRLNPNDNQGIRDVLMPLLIEDKRTDDAEALWKQYKGDGTAMWQYARALLTFIQKGDCNTSRNLLAKAIKKNPHVPKYLLGDEDMPTMPQSYSLGSEDEAVICVDAIADAWEETDGAIDWLEEHRE